MPLLSAYLLIISPYLLFYISVFSYALFVTVPPIPKLPEILTSKLYNTFLPLYPTFSQGILYILAMYYVFFFFSPLYTIISLVTAQTLQCFLLVVPFLTSVTNHGFPLFKNM